ncbi:MAG: hypothetical protein JNN15_14810 [Blastocatellia bacterium]|nr:hypothetical protein [Blastocatellia bacterium]
MFFDLFHKHYWGPPRKRANGRYYMTCYECGKERKVKIDIEEKWPESSQVNVQQEKDKKAA